MSKSTDELLRLVSRPVTDTPVRPIEHLGKVGNGMSPIQMELLTMHLLRTKVIFKILIDEEES